MKSSYFASVLIACLGVLGFNSNASAQQICSAPYLVHDISTFNSTAWFVGKNNENGEGVFSFSNNTWRFYGGGAATKIDVTHDERPVISTGQSVKVWHGGTWISHSGIAIDITVSHSTGAIYRTDGVSIYQLVGNTWQTMQLPSVSPKAISISRSNVMYAVGSTGYAYKQNGGRWTHLPGVLGQDISASEYGYIYLVSNDWSNTGFKVYFHRNNKWESAGRNASVYTAHKPNVCWYLDNMGALYRNDVKVSINQLGGGSNNNNGGTAAGSGLPVSTIPLNEINMKDAQGNTFLSKVVRDGNTSDLITVLGRGANVGNINKAGRTVLWDVVDRSKSGMTKILVDNGVNVNHVDTLGQTALSLASKYGYTTIMQELIQSGADCNIGNPLDAALKSNKSSAARMLLDGGASGSSALVTEAQYNRTDNFVMLVDYGATIGPKNTKVLDYAIAKQNRKIVQYAVRAGADPNKAAEFAVQKNYAEIIQECMAKPSFDANKITSWAVQNVQTAIVQDGLNSKRISADMVITESINQGRIELVPMAIAGGANINMHLGTASGKGNLQIVDLLLAGGADANKGMGPAISGDHTPVVLRLLEFGATATEPSYIKTAASKGNMDVVKALLNQGADPNHGLQAAIDGNKVSIAVMLIEKGANATSPKLIASASTKGQTQVVELLLARGADANAGMLGAIRGGNVDMTRLLLDNGADGSKTAFIKGAATTGKTDLVQMLLDHGANADEGMPEAVKAGKDAVLTQLIQHGGDPKKEEYVLTAVNFSYGKTLEILIKEGAPLTYVASNGQTLVHIATGKHSKGNVAQLIDAGIDVNAVDNNNETALHLAASASKNNIDMCRLLIEKGAKVNAVNNKGESILEVARGSKLKKYLKSEGAVKYK